MEIDQITNGQQDSKADILNRLKRIEGQIKGIQKMVEEGKQCNDVLTQIAAVRAAINRVGAMMLERHSKTCLKNTFQSGECGKVVDDLINTIQRFMGFID